MKTYKGRLLLRAVAEKNHATRKTVAVPGDWIGGVYFPWDSEKEEGEWVDIDMTIPEAGHMEDWPPLYNDSGVDPARIEYMASPAVGYIELVKSGKVVKAEE